VFQDVELVAGEGGFEAVGETDEEFLLVAGGRAGDDADRAARMHERVVRPAHFDEGDHLCAGEDVVRLVRHLVAEGNEVWQRLPVSL